MRATARRSSVSPRLQRRTSSAASIAVAGPHSSAYGGAGMGVRREGSKAKGRKAKRQRRMGKKGGKSVVAIEVVTERVARGSALDEVIDVSNAGEGVEEDSDPAEAAGEVECLESDVPGGGEVAVEGAVAAAAAFDARGAAIRAAYRGWFGRECVAGGASTNSYSSSASAGGAVRVATGDIGGAALRRANNTLRE